MALMVAKYKDKVVAQEISANRNFDNLLNFHNKIAEQKHITYDNSRKLEFYVQFDEIETNKVS